MQFLKNENPYRKLVVGVDEKIILNGIYKKYINLDNAATTPPFVSVINEINKFAPYYSSIHRGEGYKSELSTNIYEEGRLQIMDFVVADDKKDVVIYTKNTTDSINILAHVLSEGDIEKKVVLSTWMEHAANDLPWRYRFIVDYIDIDKSGRLILEDLEDKLIKYQGKVKLVTVTAASNVTGYINKMDEIATLSHKYGAKIHVDGAQIISHKKIIMNSSKEEEKIDFLSFSAHKMYAPFGTGILIGPKEDFKEGIPYEVGGSAINLVTHSKIKWNDPPQKDEAGTPNLMGIVALLEAIKTFKGVGMENIFKSEKEVYLYTYWKLKSIPDLIIYNNYCNKDSISIIAFNIKGIHHGVLSKILAKEGGIAVRSGFFCAHPYCQRLLGISESEMNYYFENSNALIPGITRISLGFYNTYEEINELIEILTQISKNKKYFIQKYL